MAFVDIIKEMADTPLFSDNVAGKLTDLDHELKELFQSSSQLQIREVLAGRKQFSDTVEVVNFDA